MPGDRFALAVGVGGEDQLVGAFERLGDIVEPSGRFGVDLPDHLEIGLGIDRSILGREVPDMAEGGQNLVGGPKYLLIVLALAGDSTMTIFMLFQ